MRIKRLTLKADAQGRYCVEAEHERLRQSLVRFQSRLVVLCCVCLAFGILALGIPYYREWSAEQAAKTSDTAQLIQGLRSDALLVREWSARELGRRRYQGSVTALMTALSDSESAVRLAAVEALGTLNDTRAIPAVVPLLNDGAKEVRAEASDVLISLCRPGGPGCVEGASQLLQHASNDTRMAAVQILRNSKDKKAVTSLVAATSDSSWDVQLAAVTALGDLGDDTCVFALLDKLLVKNALREFFSNKPSLVRDAARESLARLAGANPETVESLDRFLNDQKAPTDLRAALADILGRLASSSPMVVESLNKFLADPTAPMDSRVRVADIIGQMRSVSSRKALTTVVQTCNDTDGIMNSKPSHELCSASARALQSMGDPASLEFLWNATLADGAAGAYAARALAAQQQWPALEALSSAVRQNERPVQLRLRGILRARRGLTARRTVSRGSVDFAFSETYGATDELKLSDNEKRKLVPRGGSQWVGDWVRRGLSYFGLVANDDPENHLHLSVEAHNYLSFTYQHTTRRGNSPWATSFYRFNGHHLSVNVELSTPGGWRKQERLQDPFGGPETLALFLSLGLREALSLKDDDFDVILWDMFYLDDGDFLDVACDLLRTREQSRRYRVSKEPAKH